MANRRNPRHLGFLNPSPASEDSEMQSGDSRLGCHTVSDQINEVRGWTRPSSLRQKPRSETQQLKTTPHPCINQYGPSARHPSTSRPHSPTPRPHHNRRRPAPGRSSRSSPLHQPPSLPKPGSHGGGSRHRSSRPTTATPPPPRSSFRPPPSSTTVNRANFLDQRTTPPERTRSSLRHSRRLRRRPPPEPSPNADLRPGGRYRLRHQRRNSPKSPPHPPPLK